ncbi:MAG: hypothetical protein RL748_1129 [Pseudomonadota bacterium]|jgi:uncharacterized membrane protein YoaK (UPF0700 family)
MAANQEGGAQRMALLLALVAGYVDTLGFVALFGLFTAHVTGNFVLIGKELSGPGEGVLIKLLAFPAFILGVALARLAALALKKHGVVETRPLLLLQTGFLLAFMAFGLAALPLTRPDALLAILAGMCGAFAMGVQNAQGKLALAALVPTTVMTGNVTQLVMDAVDLLFKIDPLSASSARKRMARMLPPVLSFAVGAVGGAFAFHFASFWALLLPVLALLWAWYLAR